MSWHQRAAPTIVAALVRLGAIPVTAISMSEIILLEVLMRERERQKSSNPGRFYAKRHFTQILTILGCQALPRLAEALSDYQPKSARQPTIRSRLTVNRTANTSQRDPTHLLAKKKCLYFSTRDFVS